MVRWDILPRKDEALEGKWSWACELVDLAVAAEAASSSSEPHLREQEKKACHDGQGDGLARRYVAPVLTVDPHQFIRLHTTIIPS